MIIRCFILTNDHLELLDELMIDELTYLRL